MKLSQILQSEEKFRYQLLSRMQQDCDYYLGNGNKSAKHLWAGNVTEQIETMKAIWNSFSQDEKPEWLTLEEILQYKQQMS
jgi:hypothetical protein